MRVATVALVATLVAGAAVVAVALGRDEAPARATGATPGAQFGEHGKLPEISAVQQGTAPRTLDHERPLRLWVGGDSLAGSFGPALGDQVGTTGIVQTKIDYKVGSGLWAGGRDWPQRATEQMTANDPEVVVFIIGTNDTSVVNRVDANNDGTPDWEVAYRSKINRMMDTFIGTGTTPRMVLWLGAPTLRDSRMDHGAAEIDRVVKDEAGKRHANVVFVDTYRLFQGSGGGYARDINDENGTQIDARIGDGVHFSQKGAQYLARAVFTLLDAHWHLTKQADAANPIGWNFASGSGENVPGYQGAPQPRYGTVSTTASTAQTVTTVAIVPTTSGGSTTTPPTTPSSTDPPTAPPTTDGHTTTSKP
jgi:hypothetical protein